MGEEHNQGQWTPQCHIAYCAAAWRSPSSCRLPQARGSQCRWSGFPPPCEPGVLEHQLWVRLCCKAVGPFWALDAKPPLHAKGRLQPCNRNCPHHVATWSDADLSLCWLKPAGRAKPGRWWNGKRSDSFFCPKLPNLPKSLPVGKRATTALCHLCYLCWFHCTRAPQSCPRHALHITGHTPLKADTGRAKILTGTSSALRGQEHHPRVEEDGGHCPGFAGGGAHLPKSAPQHTHTGCLGFRHSLHSIHLGKQSGARKKNCWSPA